MEGIGIVPGVKAGDERLVYRLIGIAIEINRTLGPGLLGAIYENALAFELEACGLQFRSQVPVDVDYKGVRLGIGFRAYIVIEGALVLEVKAVRNFDLIHTAQLINLLKTSAHQARPVTQLPRPPHEKRHKTNINLNVLRVLSVLSSK